MGKPIIHAQSSARKFGGTATDYLRIHEFIDSSSGTFSDVRHRALTHTSWFLRTVLPLVFGPVIRNSRGKAVSVIDIAERHVLEDYGHKFIPDAHDFLALIPLQEWMTTGKHGAYPPSHKKAREVIKVIRRKRKPRSLFLEPNEEISGHRHCNLD